MVPAGGMVAMEPTPQWSEVRRARSVIMPWLWSVLVFCVLCTAPHHGTLAQMDTSTTFQPQPGMKEGVGAGGRALNLTSPLVANAGNSVSDGKSLDDLSLDDIPAMTLSPGNITMCQGKYAVGEMFSPNCEERCRCVAGGKVICEPRCQLPFVRRGLRTDPLCEEKSTKDECCVVLTCTQAAEPKSDGLCTHKNETFKPGDMWNDGCLSVCSCGTAGAVDCKPRCPVTNSTEVKEGCVSLPDRADPCCMVVFCDVNLENHEDSKTASMEMAGDLRVSSADALNSTTAIVHFVGEPALDANLTAEASEDGERWEPVGMEGGVVVGLKPGRTLRLRVLSGGRRSNAVMVSLPQLETPEESATVGSASSASNSTVKATKEPVPEMGDDFPEYCNFKGHNYTLGQEFNDACVSFCICTDTGVDCSPIECPSEFGLDVLDPSCLKWETRPRDFTPKAPNCCSDKVRCLDNGSCGFMGQTYPNWAEIPSNITGCDQKCYCELGNVTCQNVCPPVAPTPPADLPCPAAMAQLQLYPGDACCRFWVCPPSHSKDTQTALPPNASTKEDSKGSSEPPHNFLASFGLDEDGEPTEPPLPGPFRLPPRPKHPGKPSKPPTTDAAHIPGPPYGLQHGLHDFLSTKDEGIHGPPPFVVKPTKEDFDKKYHFEKGEKTKKPGKVVIGNEDDDLGSLVGPFPLHPPLVGDVYVSQPQNKPLPPPPNADVYHHHDHPHPGLIHYPQLPAQVSPGPTPHDLPFFHFLPPPFHDDPRITAKEHLHLPPQFNVSAHESGGGVVVQVLEPLDEHTVRLAFSVPPVLVGLHGRVEVRYTADKHEQDPSTWERQVLAPPGDLIATPQLHFDLGNLLPNTAYSIFIKVILRGISNAVESPVLSVHTPPGGELTTLPPQIPIDPELVTAEVNATWAALQWRKFSDLELQFIDGLQLRFRERDGKVFSATPLIHRSVTSYSLPDLKPNTSYEVGLFFIPFPGQSTELQAEKNINFVTALENDPYKFEIQLDVVAVKSTGVEVTWTGVPYPEDKYVNIYRVIYQSETGKEDFNSFKVAKRDSTPKITVLDLKPTTRYRLWLEAYLTNGRTKKSNVQDFVTKPGVQTAGHSHSGKLSGSLPVVEAGDYYGPLVAVAVLAALAIMAALILLLVLMRKHSQNKAPITARKTQSAYDNPSYKTSENDPAANGNGNGAVREDNGAIP